MLCRKEIQRFDPCQFRKHGFFYIFLKCFTVIGSFPNFRTESIFVLIFIVRHIYHHFRDGTRFFFDSKYLILPKTRREHDPCRSLGKGGIICAASKQSGSHYSCYDYTKIHIITHAFYFFQYASPFRRPSGLPHKANIICV